MGLFKNTFLNLIRIIYMNKIIDYNFCPVYFGSIKESGLTKLISSKYSNSRIIILVDQNTHDNCLDYLLDSCSLLQTADVVLMPVGEENKVIEVFYQVQQVLSDFHLNRKGLIINLGGGVVTDMGGFISSVYKRGIDFIHIPTTLLGIVDASIGGKTGINIGPYKNQIGTFSHPVFIHMDSFFVKSLPENEIMNGYAEMLKHALVMDAGYWNSIKNISTGVINPITKIISSPFYAISNINIEFKKYQNLKFENKILQEEIKQLVRKIIGPIAKPEQVQIVSGLPKTRSGKIMRRILRKVASKDLSNIGDISTLLNPEIVKEIIKGAGLK